MILSVSRRTYIPNYYLELFLKEKYDIVNIEQHIVPHQELVYSF